MSKRRTLLALTAIVCLGLALCVPKNLLARRLSGSITVTTTVNTTAVPGYDLIIFEVTNNTGEPLLDFHVDPDNGSPAGLPQPPFTNFSDPTGSPLSGDGNWATGTSSTGGSHAWACHPDFPEDGLADGATAFFPVYVSDTHPPGESRGDAMATNDSDNDDSDGVTARTDCAGVPASS